LTASFVVIVGAGVVAGRSVMFPRAHPPARIRRPDTLNAFSVITAAWVCCVRWFAYAVVCFRAITGSGICWGRLLGPRPSARHRTTKNMLDR